MLTIINKLFIITIILLEIVSQHLSIAMASPTSIKTVLVSGANGYLASHIVKQLLEKQYNVHACVRNKDNISSISHLLKIPNDSTGKLTLFSTGDLGDSSLVGRYDTPLVGCDAVIHAASPLNPKLKGGEYDGVRDM